MECLLRPSWKPKGVHWGLVRIRALFRTLTSTLCLHGACFAHKDNVMLCNNIICTMYVYIYLFIVSDTGTFLANTM